MMVNIIIATAFNRNELLIDRALRSVYLQSGISKNQIRVMIVDDNNERQVEAIKQKITSLRTELKLTLYEFETIVIPNERIKFQSGTGAWNTGILYVKNYEDWKSSFIAILDDDDAFLPDYIKTCMDSLEYSRHKRTIAVFCQLIWRTNNNDVIHDLTLDKLTQENFYIGNPGVQGSNTFISSEVFNELNGFDETYPNCNDRELMIRLLDYIECHNKKTNIPKLECKVIERPLVLHYNHSGYKVNTDKISKKEALDIFYKRYKSRFSEEAFEKSLKRAKLFFDYDYSE